MHEPPPDDRPGCRETLVITRAVFAIVTPILVAMIGVLGGVTLAFALFGVHPALALLPLAALGGGLLLFARWERRRFRGPEDL
jgi:hypothetical protein